MSQVTLVLPGENPPTTPCQSEFSSASLSLKALDEAPDSPETTAELTQLASQIDFNRLAIARFGETCQHDLKSLIDEVLERAIDYETDTLSSLLLGMNQTIEQYNEKAVDSNHPSLLMSSKFKLKALRLEYEAVSSSLQTTADQLDGQRQGLLKHADQLEEIRQRSLGCLKHLSLHIRAARHRLADERSGHLEALREQAEVSRLEEDIFAYQSYADLCYSLDERIGILEISKTSCFQLLCQLQIMQQSDFRLEQAIQSNILNTLPGWRQAMITAFALNRHQTASSLAPQASEIGKILTSNQKLISSIQLMISTQEGTSQAQSAAVSEIKGINSLAS